MIDLSFTSMHRGEEAEPEDSEMMSSLGLRSLRQLHCGGGAPGITSGVDGPLLHSTPVSGVGVTNWSAYQQYVRTNPGYDWAVPRED